MDKLDSNPHSQRIEILITIVSLLIITVTLTLISILVIDDNRCNIIFG